MDVSVLYRHLLRSNAHAEPRSQLIGLGLLRHAAAVGQEAHRIELVLAWAPNPLH